MKKTAFTLFLILSQSIIWAQAPNILWQNRVGGNGYEIIFDIQETREGGYVAVGYTNSTNISGNHASQDGWVVKLSNTGAIQWQRCLGGSVYDSAYSIRQTADDGYIVVGYASSNDGDVTGNHSTSSDAWIIKLSGTGSIQWQKTYGGTNSDEFNSVQLTPDGGYIIAGTAGSSNGDITGSHGIYDFWVLKLSSLGILEWQKTYGGSQTDKASSIQVTADGGYIIAGHTVSTDGQVTGIHGAQDMWIIKISGTGELEWQKTLGGSYGDYALSVQQATDLGYIVAGYTSSTDGDVLGNDGGQEMWVVKLSATGVIEWQKTFGGSWEESAYSIQLTADGGYILSGSVSSINGDVSGLHGTYDAWVVKLNYLGELQWQKCLGGTNSDWARSVRPTSDGGFIVSGITISNNGDVSGGHGGWDAWIIKLGPELSTDTFDKQKLSLYPNPASNLLNLQLEDSQILDKVTITDLTGKIILVENKATMQLMIGQLAKGTYLVEAILGKERWAGKFIKE